MKVLHIINALSSGGAENLLNNMLPLMKEKNIEVELLLLTTKDSMYYDSLKDKIKITISPVENIRSFKQITVIKNYIKNGNFDVVHAHLFPVLYWTSLAVKRIKKTERPKLIYTEHSTNNRRRKWYFRFLEKYIYKTYDRVIAISEGVNNELSKWLGKNHAKRIITIHNGVPLEKFKNAIPYKKNDLISGLNEADKMILMVGRFSEQKDQKTLIKAISLLPLDYHLVLVGEGPNLESCKSLSMELGIKDRVHFLGRRNDVGRITKTADLCVISSHWEGFGLVALETMAAGKVIFGSNVIGLKEVIRKSNQLFEKGNAFQLKEMLFRFFNSSDMRDYQLGHSLEEKIRKFSIEFMCDNYISLYVSLKESKEVR
ncbi:MAG: glycosyltransferase [Acholeplasma sp.]|nr:glycosyltransferase [Acholeplasma sp.]